MNFHFSLRQAKYTAVFILFIFFLYHGMTFAHEDWHRSIYQEHDCSNITVEFEYFDFDSVSAVTKAEACNRVDLMQVKHSKVHKVQMYAYIPFLVTIFLFEMLLLKLFYRRDKDKT